MNKEFIPYEQELEMKDLGFIAEPIIDSWRSLTLYQQAFRWFRNNGIDTTIVPMIMETYKEYQFIIFTLDEVVETGFDTYEEAELACLIKLIEISKKRIS